MRNSLTAFAPTFVSRLQSHRDAQKRRQSLRRELAAFNTPAERLELDEILARHNTEEARLMKELLRRQDADHLMRPSR
jgi:hypothetical protein